MKPFLLLQLRPEDEAADNEYEAFLKYGGLKEIDVERHRIEKTGFPEINLDKYSGVIVGGGPQNVSDPEDKKSTEQLHFEAQLTELLDQIAERDFPYFGACYGLGFLARHLGGKVSIDKRVTEVAGAITVRCTKDASSDPLMQGIPGEFRAIVGHKEGSRTEPPGTTLLATSSTCHVQMIRFKKNIYGTQFHPELDPPGLVYRIDIYKHHGYFPPEAAASLQEKISKETVTVPMRILAAFVTRYARY